MVVTLDTSHVEISPVNLFAPGTESQLSNQLISVTAETFHDLISPCGPLEQSADSFRHSLRATWSSVFDFGVHPVLACYCRDHTVGFRVRVRIMITVSVRGIRSGYRLLQFLDWDLSRLA